MSRIEAATSEELTAEGRRLVEKARRLGAPDHRIASIFVRAEAGRTFLESWASQLYEGALPHRLKEIVRIYISVAHECGYCSSVRSILAQDQGLDEELIAELADFEYSENLSSLEKAALRFAHLFKSGDGLIDDDSVFADLREHFTDEQIIELGLFCGICDGVGKFGRALNLLTFDEACAVSPHLSRVFKRREERKILEAGS